MARVNIMAEARKRTLESMIRVATVALNAETQQQPEHEQQPERKRKKRGRPSKSESKAAKRKAFSKWYRKNREEYRLKMRLRYHKRHPEAKTYKKCWTIEELKQCIQQKNIKK